MSTARYVEDEFSRRWDRCLTDAVLKFGKQAFGLIRILHSRLCHIES